MIEIDDYLSVRSNFSETIVTCRASTETEEGWRVTGLNEGNKKEIFTLLIPQAISPNRPLKENIYKTILTSSLKDAN